MDTKITYEEEAPSCAKIEVKTLVLAITVSQTLKDRNVRGIQ